MKPFISFLLILTFFACSCTQNVAPCPLDIACTEEFRSIGVTILDSAGTPVTLDRYSVFESGNELAIDFNLGLGEGWHTIFSDTYQMTYQNQEVTITLEGYLGGEMVVNQDYVVGADCCHVFLVSGPEEIRLT